MDSELKIDELAAIQNAEQADDGYHESNGDKVKKRELRVLGAFWVFGIVRVLRQEQHYQTGTDDTEIADS